MSLQFHFVCTVLTNLLRYCRELEHIANLRFKYIFKGSEDQERTFEQWSNSMKEGLAKHPEIYENLHPDFGVGCRR